MEAPHRLLEYLGTGAHRQVPDGSQDSRGRGTCRRACEPSAMLVLTAHRAAAPGRRAGRPRAPASPSAGAPWCRRSSSTPPRRCSGVRSGAQQLLACSRAASVLRGPIGLGDPEAEAVVHGDVEPRRRRPGPAAWGPRPGVSVSPTIPVSPAAAAAIAFTSTAPRSREGSPKLCWTWRPSQISPFSRTRAGAAPGSSEHRVTGGPVLEERERGRRRRHQLAQSDDVALRGQALERPC